MSFLSQINKRRDTCRRGCFTLKQKALLPQTDRATRCVSRYLVNCCTNAGTRCTTNPQQIKAMELEHYGRQTSSKLCVLPRCVDCRKCGHQARPSTSFVDNTICVAVESLGQSFRRPLNLDPNFLKT